MAAAGRFVTGAAAVRVHVLVHVLVLVLGLVLAGACTPLVVPPGPDLVRPVAEPAAGSGAVGRLRLRDGVELPLRAWQPEGPVRAVVLALHGFNDYGAFMAQPAQRLTRRGLAVYAYDQRGFGAAPHPGKWPGRDALVGDLTDAVTALRRRHPGKPLYLLGESMGAAVVMVAMAGRAPPEVDGVVLSAPAVWARRTMTPVQRNMLWFMAHTLPWLPLSGRNLGIQASDNIPMLRALGRDPLVIKETRVDAIWGLANLMDAALDAAPRLPGPALVLYGEKDEVIRPGPALAMARRLRVAGLAVEGAGAGAGVGVGGGAGGGAAPEPAERDVRLALYPDGWHMLLRDLGAAVVLDDIAAWIGDPAAPLPSGADRRSWTQLSGNP